MLDETFADGDPSVVVVSIDIDVNESASQVQDRAEDHADVPNSYWSISPQAFTNTLVDEFGPTVLNPPTAPIIVINAEQTDAYLMGRGKKSEGELTEAVVEASGN